MKIRSGLAVMALLPMPLAAQHDHARSPYAGLAIDTASTMTLENADQLRRGEGMGLALVAELNGYPGPKHAIELADMIGLSEGQVTRLEAVREAMTAQAIDAGAEILESEADLTALFQDGAADEAAVAALTLHIGRITGRLRAIHLQAHVKTRALLTQDQLRAYDEHRGYREPPPAR